MLHIDSLLGNEPENNSSAIANETATIAMQQLRKYTTVLEQLSTRNSGDTSTFGNGVFYGSTLRLHHSTYRVMSHIEAGRIPPP